MEEKKIGFDSNPPDPKGKKIKFSSVNKKTPLRRWTVFFLVLGIIFTNITLMYFFLPIFNVVIMLVIGLLLSLLIIFIVVFSFGIALSFDGFRSWVGQSWGILEWLNNVNQNIDKLNPYFIYFLFPTLFINMMSIILSSVGQKKEKGYVTYIVVMSLYTLLLIIFGVIYYINGMKIIS